MTGIQMLLKGAGKQLGLACITMLLSLSMTSAAVAQDSAVSHDTWSSGTPMRRAILSPTAAALGNRIYVVGGAIDWIGTSIANTQIYNPASNTWSGGVSLPAPLQDAAAAVVNNILYVFGGQSGHASVYLNTVWAYDPQTKTWSPKSPMPTARAQCFGGVEEQHHLRDRRLHTVPASTTSKAMIPRPTPGRKRRLCLLGSRAHTVGLIGALDCGRGRIHPTTETTETSKATTLPPMRGQSGRARPYAPGWRVRRLHRRTTVRRRWLPR